MKYALFIAALFLLYPLAQWIRQNQQHTKPLWTLIGALPFLLTTGPHGLYIALISWPEWPGYVKGLEFSLIDLLALALYVGQPAQLKKRRLPFRLPMAIYFVAVLLSALFSAVPIASLFYAWQLARMYLVYVVVARACSDRRVVPAILSGMAMGLAFQVFAAVWERFGEGVLQTSGTIGDKNLLGMMTHFVFLPWFALLLAGERGRLPILAPIAGALVTILTVSRAALGLNSVGAILLFVVSAMRKWTTRKAVVVVCATAILIALSPLVIMALEKRAVADYIPSGYDERAAFEAASKMMIADHPLGVGANYYVVAANVGGYNARAKVAPRAGSTSTNVHNAYLLATAETGILGLIAFLCMLVPPSIVAFRCGWRSRKDQRGDLLLGIGIALLAVYIHNFFEWIFFTFQSQYLFAMTIGLVAGVAQQLGYWQINGKIRSTVIGVAPSNATSDRASERWPHSGPAY